MTFRYTLSVAAAALLALSGCSTTRTMSGIMESWQGAPLDAVVAQWGFPSGSMPFQDKTIYSWSESAQLYIPATTSTTATVTGNTVNATSTTVGGGVSNWSCTRRLVVDETEHVVAGDWSGNNCPFGELMQYANWRRKSTQAPP